MHHFIIHPSPEKFNAAEPLLNPRGGPHNTCQNIQPGSVTINAFTDIIFSEKVSFEIGLRRHLTDNNLMIHHLLYNRTKFVV